MAKKYDDAETTALTGVYVVSWGDKEEVVLRSTYGWMDDPQTASQVVLHELHLDGEPIWHKVGSVNYYEDNNPNYFPDIEDLIQDFLKNGKRPHKMDDELLDLALGWAKRRGVDG